MGTSSKHISGLIYPIQTARVIILYQRENAKTGHSQYVRSDDMTKAAALYNFFSGFDIPAYEENSVYSMETAPAYPYLTYEVTTDSFEGNDVPLTFSLWYRSTSWVDINAKSDEISAAIGRGALTSCDKGTILIHRGHPFAQRLGDSSDDMVKRISHNITVRFYTND